MVDDQGHGTIAGHALPDYLAAFFPRRFIPKNRRRISHQQKYRPRLRQTQPRANETLSDRRKNGHLIAPNRPFLLAPQEEICLTNTVYI